MTKCNGSCSQATECAGHRYKPGVQNLDRTDKPSLTHEWISQMGMAGGEEVLFNLKQRFQKNYDQAVNSAEQRLAMEQLAEVDNAIKNQDLPKSEVMEEFLREATVVASEPTLPYGSTPPTLKHSRLNKTPFNL